ncbi:hypothetical protein H9P43_008434 [Blastocladiella emersonii ATCC 22665]|nr:hypothetical protein H9P43_008434 [Blastocladiella emersonii ATCC 22665]
MIKPKALSEVLASACTGGVTSALLVHSDGSLLAYAGPSERDAHVHGAIAANAWSVYDKNGTPMVSMLVQIEDGAVFTARVTPVLALCLVAGADVELGVLRQKGLALREYLEGPLKQL